MRRVVSVLAGVLLLGILGPSVVYAQASIAGVVKDASGAVLPGVTVEASSPALIEKVRSVTTDGSGQYRIVDLRPGTYTVTFTLTGFTVVKREGIELTGSFNATINADLRVGGLQETITVTGESPIVDTQSVRRQTTLDHELLTSAPTARSWAATAVLIPGIVTQAGASADIQITPQMTVFGGMGGRSNEGRMQVDGLNTGAALNGGGVSTYVADVSNAQEVVTTTSGGLGEAEVGGPSLSIVPRSGGNTRSGQAYLSGVSTGMVGSNYSDDLKSAGLSTPGSLVKQWDFTGGVGGPIVRDRVWYYVTARDEGQWRTIPGVFPNKNANDPTKWVYEPDITRTAQGAESFQLFSARFTAQATQRNKFNVHWDWQLPCNGAAVTTSADACRTQPDSGAVVGALGLGGLTATTSPETAQYLHVLVQNRQFTWSSPVTNKLLLEAGLGSYVAKWGPNEAPGNATRNLVRVTEQASRTYDTNGNGVIGDPDDVRSLANLAYRSANWAQDYDNPNTWRASGTYVTGGHNMKVGYIGGLLREDIENHGNDLNLAYTFNNGVPSQLTESLRVYRQMDRVEYAAIYAQDQWTMGKMTLQGALRFDRAWSYSPEQTIGPTNYLSTQLSFPKTPGVSSYKDLSPRGGVAYDVFGNGKTSVKVNVGKYLEPASNLNGNYSISNPIARIATTTSRTWTDNGANGGIAGDFTPQCDLQLVDANGECGRMNSPTFGTATRTTAAIDPAILNGWNIRPGDWQIGASVQQELMPRISMEVGYFHRWLTHYTVTDNQNLGPNDFTAFTLAAPSDSRLPNGGNYPISGLYNLTADGFAKAASNNVTFADNFGKQTQVYNGVLVNLSARARNGLTMSAGVNSGKTVNDLCDLRAAIPELANAFVGTTNPYCHVDPGFVTKVTGLASYTIPRIDVLIAGTIRSDQGSPLRATWNAPKGQCTAGVCDPGTISAALGRTAQGAGSTIAVDLIQPGEKWGDRVNEVDLRFAKVVRFGRTRTHVGIDIFNVLNSDAILTYNQTFAPGGAWLAPQSVLTPRFVKVSAQIDF
ncbi:MAG TPA: carboxypeptidase regulatory-like domain-containing protein [Vicinamibacterales bacterium]|nr:carboxypeptidase regulatory-like domain-containing protein [Vicinamibacterales bacterium]